MEMFGCEVWPQTLVAQCIEPLFYIHLNPDAHPVLRDPARLVCGTEGQGPCAAYVRADQSLCLHSLCFRELRSQFHTNVRYLAPDHWMDDDIFLLCRARRMNIFLETGSCFGSHLIQKLLGWHWLLFSLRILNHRSSNRHLHRVVIVFGTG